MNILIALWSWRKLILTGAVVLALVLGLAKIAALSSDNEALAYRLEGALAQAANAEARARIYAADLAASYAAAAARERENGELRASLAREQETLRAAFAADPESCEWSRERIPAGVLEVLGCGQ
jgi:hypothetical protein